MSKKGKICYTHQGKYNAVNGTMRKNPHTENQLFAGQNLLTGNCNVKNSIPRFLS
jgi:hypothetical protein